MKFSSICIIPARGGSKRVPRKNIKNFLGKPIIAYSIEAALSSGVFYEVMVSTDDEEIASIAKEYGASVPFLRSSDNANDSAGLAEVLIEVVEEYENREAEYDIISCVLPTAPFVTSKKLNNAHSELVNSKANALVPVVEFDYPVQRAFITKGDFIEMKWPDNYSSRSQDLETFYHDAGQFYFIKTESLLLYKKLLVPGTSYIQYSSLEVQDIDTEDDWAIAELKYKNILRN